MLAVAIRRSLGCGILRSKKEPVEARIPTYLPIGDDDGHQSDTTAITPSTPCRPYTQYVPTTGCGKHGLILVVSEGVPSCKHQTVLVCGVLAAKLDIVMPRVTAVELETIRQCLCRSPAIGSMLAGDDKS